MPHHAECFTTRCAHEADQRWWKKHKPKVIVTTFDLCVANQEEGNPGSTTMSTVRWDTQQGVYEGGYSEENSKWLAGRGGRFARHAYEATPLQQIETFHENGRKGEWTLSNWPTIARC